MCKKYQKIRVRLVQYIGRIEIRILFSIAISSTISIVLLERQYTTISRPRKTWSWSPKIKKNNSYKIFKKQKSDDNNILKINSNRKIPFICSVIDMSLKQQTGAEAK